MHMMESHGHITGFLMNWSRDLICQRVADALAARHGNGFEINAFQTPAVSTVCDGTKEWQKSRMSMWLTIKTTMGGESKRLVQIPFKAKLVEGKMDGPALINDKRLERDALAVAERLAPKFVADLSP